MKALAKDIVFVGIGGCGTNIAFMFEKAGYTAIHINSSEQDESAIKGAKIIKHLKGFNGCAGDRRLAAKAMAKNIEIVDELLEVEEEFIFLVWGAGGGTGSGIAPVLASMLCEELEEQKKKKTVCGICVLPDKDEDLGFHENAYNCCKELLEIDELGCVMFLDNNYNPKKLAINDKACSLFHSFISNNSVSAIGNVEEEEKRTILRSHGNMVVCNLAGDKANTEKVVEVVTTDNIFAPLQQDGIVEYIAVINSDNKELKKDMLTSVFGVPKRTFTGYGSKNTIVVASGLNYPFQHVKKLAELAKEKNRERLMGRRDSGSILEELQLEGVQKQEPAPKKKKSRRDLLMELND